MIAKAGETHGSRTGLFVLSTSREPVCPKAGLMIFGTSMSLGLGPNMAMLNFWAWHVLIKYIIYIIYLNI